MKEIFRIIGEINRLGTTVLLVEQNTRQALALSRRGYVLENGRVVLEGSGAELLGNEHVKRAYQACRGGQNVTDWTIGSLAEAITTRKLSPVEAVQGYLDRIEKLNPTLRAFITVDAEGALARARALEKEPPRGPLHGVPLAYKDLCAVERPAHFVRHAHGRLFPVRA